MRKGRPALTLIVPSQTEFLGLVRDVAQRMARLSGFEEADAERIALAVDEAATNVLEHAYDGAADREVELRFEDRGPDFCVDLHDTGASVDPLRVPEVNLERYVSERRTGGLGVHLMGKIMDSVTFGRSGSGNLCCLVKHKAERGPS